ncbi:MAG: rod shape-determining protein MreD [Bacteroidota bacterium]
MERHLRSALIVLGLLLLQTTFVPLLGIRGSVPDLLVIWVVSNALRRGQVEGMTGGFLVGLLQDLTATQFLGLAALGKTVAGFATGYFYNENKTDLLLGTYRFMVIVGIGSLAHNLLYYSIFLQGIEGPIAGMVVQESAATALYTVALSALPMFAFSKRQTL